MATVTPSTVDLLSKDERLLVIRGLVMLKASLVRAAKAEANPAIRELREAEAGGLDSLTAKFR